MKKNSGNYSGYDDTKTMKKLLKDNELYRRQLEIIADCAADRDQKGVIRQLMDGVNYRDAMIYCENVKRNNFASRFIYDWSHCAVCGCVAVVWKEDCYPRCANCEFREQINNHIEYDNEPIHL